MLEAIARILPDDLQRRCLDWLAFIGQNIQGWPFGGRELHGQGHWSRVCALALLIGRDEGFSDADLDCLAAAAAFHDARRLDEFLDTGHGLRGADYYAAFCAEHGLPFDPRAWLAMAWHDRDDEPALQAIRAWEHGTALDNGLRESNQTPDPGFPPRTGSPDPGAHAGGAPVAVNGIGIGMTSRTGEIPFSSNRRHLEGLPWSDDGWHADAAAILRAFKDADALDRLRMGTWALDESYLRLCSSRELLPFARRLVFASLGPGCAELDSNGVPTLRPVPSKVPVPGEPGVAWDVAVSEAAPRPVPVPYLVVVDVQNDFVDGSLGSAEAVAALPAMVEKVRDFPGTVVFTKDTHDRFYGSTQEGSNLPVPHCIAGEAGWELAGDLARLQRERDLAVYLKGTFGSPELAADLEAARARGALASVELIGLCTDICVVSNALLVKAALPEVPVRVDAACCAGTSVAAHEAALQTMRSCQIEVV